MSFYSGLGLVSILVFLSGCWFIIDSKNSRERVDVDKSLPTDVSDSLFHARVAEWTYPRDITREEANKITDRLKASGVTHVLTEGHRYILYDLKDANNPPDFLFTPQPAEKSIAATKIVTDALHSRGLYCLHHVTSTYATKDFMEQHRDWTQRDARYPDEPLFFEMYGGVYVFCLNNPGFREEFFRTVLDITQKTGVDGWMIDEVEWLPTWYSCGCRYCRERFKRDTGYELPRDADSPVWEDFEHPLWRAWLRWRMESAGDFFVDLKKRLDARAPGKILTACHAGASDTWLAQKWGMDIIELRRGLNWIFYEAYIRDGASFYNWRRHLAELRLYNAIARPTNCPLLALFYPRCKNESTFTWALSVLAGARCWAEFTVDKKTYPAYFSWQSDHEFLYGKQTQLANAALLYSKQTRDGYGGFDTRYYVDEWGGWAETLNEANIPHAAIIDSDLEGDYITRFDLVIAPHAVCLSDTQINALLDYQAKGGRLIITGETGMRDETGKTREDKILIETLRSRSRYIPEKWGLKTELNYLRLGEEFEDNRDVKIKQGILDAVLELAGKSLPYQVDAPPGVMVNAFQLEDGSISIHILNATGAKLPPGTVLSKSNYSVEFPPVRGIELKIRKNKDFPLYRSAFAYSYGNEQGKPLSLGCEQDTYNITLPELECYTVIHLTEGIL